MERDSSEAGQSQSGRLLLDLRDGRLTAFRIPDRFVEVETLVNLRMRIATFRGAIFVDDFTNQRQIEDTGLLTAVAKVLCIDDGRHGN